MARCVRVSRSGRRASEREKESKGEKRGRKEGEGENGGESVLGGDHRGKEESRKGG